jgi:hypothetical protein
MQGGHLFIRDHLGGRVDVSDGRIAPVVQLVVGHPIVLDVLPDLLAPLWQHDRMSTLLPLLASSNFSTVNLTMAYNTTRVKGARSKGTRLAERWARGKGKPHRLERHPHSSSASRHGNTSTQHAYTHTPGQHTHTCRDPVGHGIQLEPAVGRVHFKQFKEDAFSTL